MTNSGEWHTRTIKAMKTKTESSLRFIIKDATEAAILGEAMGNPKANQYRDEAHYANMELTRRMRLISNVRAHIQTR